MIHVGESKRWVLQLQPFYNGEWGTIEAHATKAEALEAMDKHLTWTLAGALRLFDKRTGDTIDAIPGVIE